MDPLGQRIRYLGREWVTVVGVVGDLRHFGLEADPRPEVYLSFEQGPPFGPLFVIRGGGPPETLAPAIRRHVREMDPEMAVFHIASMESLVSESLSPRRFNMRILTLFGVLALGLAAIGVYATLAHWVSQRGREIGIRLALGAARADVLRWVFRQGAGLAAGGLSAGLVVAIASGRLLRAILFGVSPSDPWTLVLSAMALAAVAFIAVLVPAYRASCVDPVWALREE